MDSLDNSVRTVLKKPKCIVEIKFLKKKCFFFDVGTPAYAMATTLRKRMIIIFQPVLFLNQINFRLTC